MGGVGQTLGGGEWERAYEGWSHSKMKQMVVVVGWVTPSHTIR